MKKIIYKILNTALKNIEIYQSNGSTWLIITDTKMWVMEYTNKDTLWYNYHFFRQLFMLASEDIIKNKEIIFKIIC